MFIAIAAVTVLVALVAYVLLVAFAGVGITTPAVPSPRPADAPEQALQKLAGLQAKDTDDHAPACFSVVLEPEEAPKATIVYFHGFTNCPNQMLLPAELMRRQGYRVFLPRQPRHGLADVLNHDLKGLSVDELTEHVAEVMDVAHGWPEPVYVSGLSVGAVLACWAAATRSETVRVLAAAPFAAPKGIPMPVVRLLIVFRRFVPGIYWWWDPRKKENLGESPYVYPGFPLPGMVPYLHLAHVLTRGSVAPTHHIEYSALLTNPGDFAIRHDRARKLMRSEFGAQNGHRRGGESGHGADKLVEWTLAKDLGWWHDFVDPDGSHHGTPEQVADVLLTALEIGDAGEDAGLMSSQPLSEVTS
ncbi:MAG: alpha/beta hydrolase [Coriobacteriales bacterium]|nr:alpha/beta hydrolase [Coriobacteriales bacterium]